MVTLTLRHGPNDRLADLRQRLMCAWRKVRAHRWVREIFSRNVSASARALEVTHGNNGWHPHLHVLLRTDVWSFEDVSRLLVLWCEIAGAALVRQCDGGPAEVGVVWSEARDEKGALYLSKLGAEVAGVGKECKGGNRTPWQIAKAAAQKDETAIALWREYQEAMRGARMLELDERAKELANRQKPEAPTQTWRADVFPEEFEAFKKLERGYWRDDGVWCRGDPLALWLVLEVAASARGDPLAQVRIALDDAISAVFAPPAAAA